MTVGLAPVGVACGAVAHSLRQIVPEPCADKAARCTFERRRRQRRIDSNNPWDGHDCLNTFTVNYYYCDNQWARASEPRLTALEQLLDSRPSLAAFATSQTPFLQISLRACLLTKLMRFCIAHARQFICTQAPVLTYHSVLYIGPHTLAAQEACLKASLVVWPGGVI